MRFESHGVPTPGVELEVQLGDWKPKELCPADSRVLEITGIANERIKRLVREWRTEEPIQSL